MTIQAGIRPFVADALANLPDADFAGAVDSAFTRQSDSIDKVEACIDRLTSRTWSQSSLEQFFHGWRDTHLSSGSVAAVTCRLQMLAEQADPGPAAAFLEAANSNSKIIHEDLGLCGETHAELFYRLATSVCKSDEWALRRNRVPCTYEFGRWVHHQRIRSDPMHVALLVTIASEIYNHGEYSMANPAFETWLERMGYSKDEVKRDLAYVTVHTGDTESGHFMHGVDALKQYFAGSHGEVDYDDVENWCAQYLSRVGKAFEGLSARLN